MICTKLFGISRIVISKGRSDARRRRGNISNGKYASSGTRGLIWNFRYGEITPNENGIVETGCADKVIGR